MARKRKVSLNPSEHDEQVAFFNFVRFKANSDDRYSMIYAIPNGGARHPAEAYRMKQAGVKAGVADIAVDVPSHGYHGLKIEMKVKTNKVTPLQEAYLNQAALYGYKTAVCYGADEAIKALEAYLNNE